MEPKEKTSTKKKTTTTSTSTSTTTPCPNTLTVRRNPPRKARATPSSTIPTTTTPSSTQRISITKIPSFPIEDILSIQIPPNPKPEPHPIPQNLKVFLRIRPQQIQINNTLIAQPSRPKNVWPQNPNSNNVSKTKLKKKKAEICLKVNDSHSVTLSPPQSLQDVKRIKSEVYQGFSHVFSADSSQEEVYEKMMSPLIEDFMKGKSGMLAALGPSGSGKTYTVFGSVRQPGMVPLALRQIFSNTEGIENHSSRTFYLSMFEIYSEKGKGEKIFDLSQDCDPSTPQSTIKGLKEAIVYDAQQAESLIAHCMTKRATAMTNSNNQSSRSQCIINLRSGPKKIDGEVDVLHSALLTIVDLAGAEREKKTGNQGARLLESNFINNTSMVFGLCLRSLLEHQKNPKKPLQKHFQSSLLTKYLRDYLEGKKRMSLILTVKSGEEDYLDASFLLRQASPFMKIKFDNVEEPFNLIGNKRNLQTLSRLQIKRVKLSNIEACAIDEEKSNGEDQLQKGEVPLEEITDVKLLEVLVQSPRTINIEVNNNEDDQFQKEEVPLEEIQEFDPTGVLVQSPRIVNLEVNDNEDDRLQKEEAPLEEIKEVKLTGVVVQSPRSIKLELHDDASLKESVTELANRDRENQIMQNFAKALWNVLKQYKKKLEVAENEIHHLRGSLTSEKLRSSELENEIHHLRESLTIEDLRSSELENELNDLKPFRACAKQVSAELSQIEVDEYKSNEFSELEGSQSTDVNKVAENQITCLRESVNSEYRKEDSAEVTIVEVGVSRENGLTELRACESTNVLEEHDNCPGDVDNGKDLKDRKYIEREGGCCSNGLTSGSGVLEPVISSSQSLVVTRDDSSSSVEGTPLQNEAEKKLLDEPVMPNEDVTSAQLRKVSNAAEMESKPTSGCKPKRRLLPASSILLKNISSIDFEDENEKPKGTRGEKNLAADVTKRTHGSISLIRLLTDNRRL